MPSIDITKKTPEQLDREKIKLEGVSVGRLRTVFRNMSQDAANLYRITGDIPAKELTLNYKSDFTKEVRDLFRKSIKQFGGNLRKGVSKKFNSGGLLVKQKVEITDPNFNEKLENIDNQLKVNSTFFIANESEAQVDFITETNTKALSDATSAATATFVLQQANVDAQITDITEQLNDLNFQVVTNETTRKRLDKLRKKLDKELKRLIKQANIMFFYRTNIIASIIEDDLNEKSDARSELIASQSIGLSEAWVRDEESSLIEEAAIITALGVLKQKKTWQTILDSRTRISHVAADGQTVGRNETFLVQGERLRFPRDPNGSPSNIFNCRCQSRYSFFDKRTPIADEVGLATIVN